MMYGETAQSAGYGDVKAPRPVPALGQLKAAAERIYKVNERIESFIGRFHGQPPVAANASAGQPIADTYRNDIESLFAIVERLETSVEALDHIG
jgi:hypothetical protein